MMHHHHHHLFPFNKRVKILKRLVGLGKKFRKRIVRRFRITRYPLASRCHSFGPLPKHSIYQMTVPWRFSFSPGSRSTHDLLSPRGELADPGLVPPIENNLFLTKKHTHRRVSTAGVGRRNRTENPKGRHFPPPPPHIKTGFLWQIKKKTNKRKYGVTTC